MKRIRLKVKNHYRYEKVDTLNTSTAQAIKEKTLRDYYNMFCRRCVKGCSVNYPVLKRSSDYTYLYAECPEGMYSTK